MPCADFRFSEFLNMASGIFSIVHWYPDLEKHRCGYCKQTNTNCSYGMWAEVLTVEDYQLLIDRGWRRSGKYCYKPVMDVTCCPLYTIRCESLHYKPSKSQKKIIKRVNRYLSDSFEDKSKESLDMEADDAISNDVMHEKPTRSFDLSKIETDQLNLCVNSVKIEAKTSTSVIRTKIDKPIKMNTSTSSLVTNCKPGKGVDPNKPPCKKAKLLRFERKQQKLAAKGVNVTLQNTVKSQSKSLEEFINDVSKTPAHRLRVCLVRTGGSKDLSRIRAQEYPVYRKYQMAVHGDGPEKCTELQFNRFLCDSPIQIVLKQMDTNEPTFKESAKLYAKYQMSIHDDAEDDCDSQSFEEFLVDTPLEHCEDPNGLESGYGSFHQQYWLDDKLIAVGVIDILPKCISSVYFFYDPDYRHLTLGTYGSLRELYFLRQLQRVAPDLKYYYMGYYIHTCPKMRYKANLSPSYLLCPETYNWFPIESCVPKLDKEKYVRFNEDLDATDKDACNTINDLDQLMILITYKLCVPFKFYKEKVKGQENDFFIFANLIGKSCIPKIVISCKHAEF